jgi:hypothetical protein
VSILQSAAPTPQQLADDAVRNVLRSQWQGVTALRLDSPPGAGKTGVVERLAVQSLEFLRERVQIVTQTNEQAFDVTRRLVSRYRQLPFHLLVRADLAIPGYLQGVPNLHVIRSSAHLPSGPCVVVANAARWSWSAHSPLSPFDLQIIDEAYQLADCRYHEIAGMAARVAQVGDPGQIDPVVACEIERWRCDPAGPHVPCPRALVERHPGVVQMALPVSRRLTPDTVRYIQPAFYPALPFTALSAPGDRGLTTRDRGVTPSDRVIDAIGKGASLLLAELAPRITGEADDELAEAIVGMIERLFARGARILDDGQLRDLEAGMIGVVCGHVSQVNAVRERLPAHLAEVIVESSNRFQGLERHLVFVHHPLSGRADADQFHLDAGRLCVMSSRHRVSCVLVARADLESLLLRHSPAGDRLLRVRQDPEFEGWRAHLSLVQQLRQDGRVLRL